MKRWIAWLLVMALAAGIMGFASAEEEIKTYDLVKTGVVLQVTEKMNGAQGLFVPQEASGVQGMDDARFGIVYYLAMSREEYAPYAEAMLSYSVASQSGAEVPDELYNKALEASQAMLQKQAALFWIVALPDGQTYEESEETLFSLLAGGDKDALEDRQLGSAGGFSYILLSPRPGAAAFAVYESLLGSFSDEYNALLADMDSVAEGIRLTGPDVVGIGSKIEFELKDLEGNPVSSSELFARNEVTLVNIYTTWCGYCYMEMPELEKLSQEYADRGVAIVGLCVDAVDEKRIAAAKQMLADTGVTYLNLAGTQELTDSLKVVGYPTTFFVDREGKTLLLPMTGALVDLYPAKIEAALQGAQGTAEEAPPAAGTGLKGVYRVKVTDGDGAPVPEAFVGFCTDTSCVPVETDEAGIAVFEGAQAKYHLQIVELPDGYAEPELGDLYIGPEDGEITLTVEKE